MDAFAELAGYFAFGFFGTLALLGLMLFLISLL